MLARLAENLFWLGRYLERAEDTALLLDVTYHGLLESSPDEAEDAWWGLLQVLHMDGPFADRRLLPTAESTAEFLVLDPDVPGSILSSVSAVRQNARTVRELISSEMWRSVNTFYLDLCDRDLREDLSQQPHDLYEMVQRRCHLLYGVASETMPRDDGWRFMMLGRMLERAEMTCRLLNVRYRQLTAAQTPSAHDWTLVLKCASAFEAYRKSYRATLEPERVVEFLLLSDDFPRSVLFCLRAAETGLTRLGPPGVVTRPQRLLGRIRANLEFQDIADLLTDGLTATLDTLQTQVWTVTEAVAEQFFRHELRADLQLHALSSSG